MGHEESSAAADCEYIVVGSGAGGGTVAARLAEAGHTSCCWRRAAILAN